MYNQPNRLKYLEVVNAFSQKLINCNAENEIVWAIAKHAIAQLGYVDCIVYLFDEHKEVLVQKAAHGPKNPVEFDIKNPITLKVGQGICGNVFETGIGEVIKDTSNDSRYHIDDDTRLSEITIPVKIGKKTIGVIDSEHPEKGFYNDLDFEILTTIANLAGVKLSQIKTQEELKKHKEALEIKVLEQKLKLKKSVYKLKISHNELTDKISENETLLKEVHHRVKNNLKLFTVC